MLIFSVFMAVAFATVKQQLVPVPLPTGIIRPPATPAVIPKCVPQICPAFCPNPTPVTAVPCARGSTCAAFPQATCCPGCCGAEVWSINAGTTDARAVNCAPPPVPCANSGCKGKDAVEAQCRLDFPRGYELITPDLVKTCCFSCISKPTVACRCIADDLVKKSCDGQFGVGNYTTSRDALCSCLSCTAIVKPEPVPCTQARCLPPSQVMTECQAKGGMTTQGRCCLECRLPVVCPAIPCNPVDKDACTKNGGVFIDGPCCPSCAIKDPNPNPCNTLLCNRVDRVECDAKGGEIVTAPGGCCPTCQPKPVICPDVLCERVDKAACLARGGEYSDGPCCASCKEKENPCALVRCQSKESVAANCKDGTVQMGQCCPFCQGNNPCTQTIELGTGRGRFPVFGWDKDKKACVKFTFGGVAVQGNTNRFDTEEACRKKCAPVIIDDTRGNSASTLTALSVVAVVVAPMFL